MSRDPAFQERLDELHRRVDIAAVIAGAGVRLGRGRRPRGKCPFHGSKSDSFAVDVDRGRARCWGCGWSGDSIRFVSDHYGLSFREAVDRLEAEYGLDGSRGAGLGGLAARPVRRAKEERARAPAPRVNSGTMARFIWRRGRPELASIRPYFRARGIPERMLGDRRLADFRFLALAPIEPWPVRIGRSGPVDFSGPPSGWPAAPAIAALIRRPISQDDGATSFRPIGVHVTWLSPSLEAKMERRRDDGATYPARKMLGASRGGCVLLYGETCPEEGIDQDAPLFVGEGNETVLSGMTLADAGEAAVGLAALSLDNLQGFPRLFKGGVLPLYDLRPDPDRPPAIAFAHRGPVTGLIDADMKPLRGPRDRVTGAAAGVPLIERRGGPIVRRAISTAERAEICADLFAKAWRAAGCRRVRAMRPPMGSDFNDAIRAAAPEGAA